MKIAKRISLAILAFLFLSITCYLFITYLNGYTIGVLMLADVILISFACILITPCLLLLFTERKDYAPLLYKYLTYLIIVLVYNVVIFGNEKVFLIKNNANYIFKEARYINPLVMLQAEYVGFLPKEYHDKSYHEFTLEDHLYKVYVKTEYHFSQIDKKLFFKAVNQPTPSIFDSYILYPIKCGNSGEQLKARIIDYFNYNNPDRIWKIENMEIDIEML